MTLLLRSALVALVALVRADRRERDERGAVAVFVGALSVVLVVSAAFAVDLGMSRVARRDMQALADVVALDAARLLNGRTAAEIRAGDGDFESLATTVDRSAARNGDTLGSTPVMEATLVNLGADGEPAVDPVTGSAETPDGEVPDAVQVTASTTVDYGFARVIGVDEGRATRESLAAARATGCALLGSWLVREDLPDGVGAAVAAELLGQQLNAALGLSGLPSADVTALGYNGLADAAVSINDLLEVDSLAAGSVDELLETELTAAEFATVLATALSNNGNAADAAVITNIFTVANTAGLGTTFTLGDLISASNQSGAALETGLNVFQLLTSSIFVASGENLAAVSPGTLSVPGVSSLGIDMHLIQSPQPICGPEGQQGQTAQVALDVTGDLLSPGSLPIPGQPLGIPGLLSVGLGGTNLAIAATSFTLEASAAGATGTLTSVSCAEGTPAGPDSMQVTVDPYPASASLSMPLQVTGSIPLTVRLIGGLITLSLTANVTAAYNVTAATTTPGAEEVLDLDLPPNDLEPVTTSSGLNLAGAVVNIAETTPPTVSLAGNLGPLSTSLRTELAAGVATTVGNAVTGLSSSLVTPLLGNLDTQVLDLLQDLIGLSVTGADVLGVPRPDCATPVLRG